MDVETSQLPLEDWERSSFSPVSSIHSSTTEQAYDCPTGLQPQLSRLSLGRDIPLTPNVSPTESKPINFQTQSRRKDSRSPRVLPQGLSEASEAFITHQASLILDDDCVKDFSTRTQHLYDNFKRSADSAKALHTCGNEEILRIALWWFLCGRMKLEPLLREAPSSPFAEQVNKLLVPQAHVDLAKALWILLKTRHSGSEASSPKVWEATRVCRENDEAGFPALRLRLLIRIRNSIWAMTQNGLLPQITESNSSPEDVDMSIWIRYPLSNLDMGYLITRYHSLDCSKNRCTPISTLLPLGDTKDLFHYGGMHVDLFLAESTDPQHVSFPAILSIVRGLDEKNISIIVGTQDGLLNLVVSSSGESLISWDDVIWVTPLTSLVVKLRTGFRFQLRFGAWDYQTLKRIYDYCSKALETFEPSKDEGLVFETDIKSTQYQTTSNSESRIFPRNSVAHCTLRLFEKTAQWSSATGLRRAHCGFRISVLTPTSFKNLSVLSQEQPLRRVLQFYFPKSNDADSTTLSLRIDADDSDSALVLAFAGLETKNNLLAHLTGCLLREGEAVDAQVQLNNVSFSSGLDASTPAQSINDFQWQSLRVVTRQPSEPEDVLNIESSQPVQSESLRIIIDSPKGRITDRVNVGIGELRIRRNVIASGHELHVLRMPQEDLSFSLFSISTAESERPDNLETDLDTLHTQPSIRTYNFPNLWQLHLFQSAITGFSILFDGMATSFLISRRRMMIPIHKEWSSPHTRIQVLRRGKVVQLAAFFEGFRHGKAMNFALKGTDIFEKSTKGGKISLKIADAKFSLPTGGKLNAGNETGFVCLDLLEYPGEHDNIHIGFATDADFMTFSQSLPAPMKLK